MPWLSNRDYRALNAYLDRLDAIKEKIARETAEMTVQERTQYFAGARNRLAQKLGRRLHLPRPR